MPFVSGRLEVKMFHVKHLKRSGIDEGDWLQSRYFFLCRCAGVQVCRCAGVQVCRCAGASRQTDKGPVRDLP